MIISTEGVIDGNFASGNHQRHFHPGTISGIRTNQYLPALVGEEEKSSQHSKQSGCAVGQKAKHKATMRNFQPNSELPPKPVQGATSDQHCSDFNFT